MSERKSYKSHTKEILGLGVPLIGSHVAQFAVHVTDTVMLGWYNLTALAAVVLAGSLFFTLFLVGSGFAWAVMPIVASAAASGQETQVRRVTRMAMWLSILFGVLVMPVFIFGERILIAIGQEPELASSAATYLMIAGWGILPALQVMVLKSYLSALERAQVVLWVTVATAVLNAIVNYALIFGHWGAPELGIAGAAIGSVILQLISMVMLMVYCSWVTPEHALFQRFWRPDWEAFGRVFRLGWPIGVTSFAEAGLFSASAIMMGWVGTVELAAHGIALQLASFAFIFHLGLANVATIRAGKAYGRGDGQDLRDGAVMTVVISGIFAVIAVMAFLIVPEFLMSLFIDPSDLARPAVLATGVSLLAMAALFQVADAGQVIALGLLRGVQETRAPMFMATISYWVIGMPISYYLGFSAGMGGVGIWLGLVIGLTIAWITMSIRFWGKSLGGLTSRNTTAD